MKKLKVYLDTVWEVILRSPVEIIISTIFLGISQYLIFADSISMFYDELCNLLYYFLICIAVPYSTNIIFRKNHRIFYYLSIFLVPILFLLIRFFGHNAEAAPVTITTICSILLIFASKNLIDNRSFVQNAMLVVKNIVVTSVLISIALLIFISITFSIDSIFNYQLDEKFILMTNSLFFFLFSPILFLISGHRDKGAVVRVTRFMNILFNYILAPSVVIYGVILYLYFAKIAVLWELPKGVISTTAMIFLIGGIFVSACRTILEKKTLSWVFNYFSYVAIPAILIFWVSALYRVFEHGLTGNRVYLLITLITLTAWLGVMLKKKYAKFQYLTVVIIAIYMVFTYVPGISYGDFNRRARDKVEEVEKMNIFLYPQMEERLDIKGYKTIIQNPTEYLSEDTLFILSPRNNINDVLYQKNINDVLEEIYTGLDLKNYKSESKKTLRETMKKKGLYRDEDLAIMFDYFLVERNKFNEGSKEEFESSFVIVDAKIEWIMIK